MVIWFTGMSGSGKSTLTESLRSFLQEKGFSICVIDRDFVRKLNKTVNHFTVESILKNNYQKPCGMVLRESLCLEKTELRIASRNSARGP